MALLTWFISSLSIKLNKLLSEKTSWTTSQHAYSPFACIYLKIDYLEQHGSSSLSLLSSDIGNTLTLHGHVFFNMFPFDKFCLNGLWVVCTRTEDGKFFFDKYSWWKAGMHTANCQGRKTWSYKPGLISVSFPKTTFYLFNMTMNWQPVIGDDWWHNKVQLAVYIYIYIYIQCTSSKWVQYVL